MADLSVRPLRVWSVPVRYSAAGRYWYWRCRVCGHVTKDLIPALGQAYDAAVGHLGLCEEADDA